MINGEPEDELRRLVIAFYPADGEMAAFEDSKGLSFSMAPGAGEEQRSHGRQVLGEEAPEERGHRLEELIRPIGMSSEGMCSDVRQVFPALGPLRGQSDHHRGTAAVGDLRSRSIEGMGGPRQIVRADERCLQFLEAFKSCVSVAPRLRRGPRSSPMLTRWRARSACGRSRSIRRCPAPLASTQTG